jgi:hypothetical protein
MREQRPQRRALQHQLLGPQLRRQALQVQLLQQ